MRSARIGRARCHLEKLAIATLKPLGLDPGEFDVLSALLRAGPPHELAPTALNQSLMMSAGGLTKRLGRLEERGLITRRLSQDDRRSLLVTLTVTGQELGEQAAIVHSAATAEVIDRMGVETREQLSGLLRNLLLEFEDSADASLGGARHESGERGEEPALGGGAQ